MTHNKKGFTMVELLGVIVILGILSVVAITSVRGIINKSKKEQVKSQGKVLMMAAESYMQANKSELPKAIGEVSEVKASKLKSTRYLKNDLKDSAGESCMTDSFVRVYKYSNTGYSYIPFIYCGDDRAPANPTIEGPNIKVKLIGTKNKDNGQTSTNYQNVSTVSVQINIESKELNEITYPIMSYSYSIGIAEDNPDIFREVYNSGTINGNGKTTIQIDRPITEYIDITKKNIIRIKVVAIDQAGGYKEETKLVEDLEEELQNASSVKDETKPKCKNITGAAEGNEWINAEAYQKRNKIRTIKTECVDGEGSQSIRE